MSLKAAREYINRAIQSTPEYANITNMRQAMRSRVHSLNISYSTFETNNSKSVNKLSTSDLKYLYSIFIVTLKDAVGRNNVYSSLTAAEPILSKDGLRGSPTGCILVVSGINTSVIGYDYDVIRKLISVAVKSRQEFRNSPLGADSEKITAEGEITSRSVLELGHTLTSTPFAETIKKVLAYSNNDSLNNELNVILDKLYSAQASLNYEFLNKSNSSNIGAVINLVIQPRDVNASLSKEESALYRSFLNSIRRNLKISEIPGSNTLKQDALQFYEDLVVSAITGKKRSKVKKHDPVKDSVKLGKSTKNKVATFKSNDLIKSTEKITPPVNLSSLQNILNSQIYDRVVENMGDGTRDDILNFRTGRFAISVEVERLTMSRQGMITAFYSYMKYPYATFSQGGRQQNPKSRDPKLLISKSIRELAAQQVSNRMRAVLV